MRMLEAVSAMIRMLMVISFGPALSPPLPSPSSSPSIFHVRKLPEVMPLMARYRSGWPRCLLWHGWLLGLSLAGGRVPWAEQVSGAYSADAPGFWTLLIFGMLMIWSSLDLDGWQQGRLSCWRF